MQTLPRTAKAAASASTVALLALAGLTACGGSDDQQAALPAQLTCDNSIKTGFTFDQTTILAIKHFAKGDTLTLISPAPTGALTANADLCLVKLLVGPGNPGPAGAPSTTTGIGVNIWLPAKSVWDKRLKVAGGGGFIGGNQADPTQAVSFFGRIDAASGLYQAETGAIGVDNDKGHSVFGGSFGLNPDGTINQRGWTDFERANHESVIRAKALSKAYYGSEPKYSYFIGVSSGGREGLKLAQKYPTDFNGIVSGVPAINWSSFTIAELWPAFVAQKDLGGVYPTNDQFATVEQAALNACDVVGGVHLGYVLDPSQCKYDPELDPAVLCTSDGGTNGTAACISSAQARFFNKFWYGPTADGSVPSPAVDNGYTLSNPLHKWYGIPRGTLTTLARSPFSVGTDQIANSLQNSTLGSPTFLNASGNGIDGWKNLSYADFNRAFERGVQLQGAFSNVDTNNPDLSAFKAAGGKIVGQASLSDQLIMHQGGLAYYDKVTATMGGLGNVQSFYKVYAEPGAGHGGIGSTNQSAAVPLIQPTLVTLFDKYTQIMQDWVENGKEPVTLIASSATSASQPLAATAPVCLYPAKRTYVSGDPLVQTSYVCK